MLRNSLVALTLAGGLLVSPATAAQTSPDDTLKDRIEYRLETNAMVRKYDIKVKVAKGVATLTGEVATATQKAEAAKLAKIDGITKVDDQIQVDPNEDATVTERMKKGLTKTGEAITDAWILTKVKWFFLGEDALKDSSINVDVKDRIVTLKGTVKSEAGRARAMKLAGDTDGVKKVVDALAIK